MEEFSFGAWLQRRRHALDLTQAELGRRVGVAAATIRKIEADERRPSAQVAERLADALAISPSERMRFIRAARGELTNLDSAPYDVASPQATIARLLPPAPLNPLIGRADLVAAIRAHLIHPNVRLITLTGPGGVGKTRVALQVATELRADAAVDVIFVPLAPVAEPGLVGTAIADVFGLRDRGTRSALEQLRDFLHNRQILLILDNAEHLLAAAPFLADLLGISPGLRLLVTSRAVLNLVDEHVIAVPPLPYLVIEADDAAAAPSVQLFLDRAHASGVVGTWTPDAIESIAAICRWLDGLPLAI